MRAWFILFTLLVSLGGSFNTQGQQLNVENVFNSSSANNTQHGINAAYMFHHVLDENYDLSTEMENALIGTDFDVVRFPGGAIGNYYRFNGPGYGALKNEVENVANTVSCNGNGLYCFERDEFAPRNFVYDFIDLMDSKYAATGKKTDVLYMINLLLHFVYNYSEIQELETIANLTELDNALGAGTISQDFYDRIMENYSAMELIIQNPNLKITGIEMGNEFYFYQEVTTFPYPPTNSNPFFNLNSALNTVQPRIAKYLTLVNFYKRLAHAMDDNIKIAVPIGGINHFGNQANADLLWNTAIKQWVIQDVDALIPHLYVKTTAPEVNPPTEAADDDNADLVEIKQGFQSSLETKFVGILREITEFFELSTDFRELWMTEYNVNKNASSSQVWDEWTNTYLHGAFLNEIMKIMSASEYSDYLRYSIQHGLSGGDPSFEHCLLTRKNTGEIIERISHFNNDQIDYLKSLNTVRMEGNMSHSQNSWDFYNDAFYTYESDGVNCPVERFIISFSNLRSDVVAANLNFGNNQIMLDNKAYEVVSSSLKAMQGVNLASSCGKTDFNSDENNYNISSLDYAVNISQPVNIPAYAAGYIELIIEPVNNDCLPLALNETTFEGLTVDIFPNPATETIRVDMPDAIYQAASSLTIINAIGQVVRKVKIDQADQLIDVSAFESGAYFIRANAGDESSAAASFVKL